MAEAPPEAVIAFLDVIGFSATVREKAMDLEWHNNFLDVFAEKSKTIAGIRGPADGFLSRFRRGGSREVRILTFSDSIVVSAPESRSAGWRVAGAATALAIELMEKALFCRGGLVRGRLAQTDKSVVGEGLIRAVELEKESAIYPRVVIDDPVALTLRDRLNRPNSVATIESDLDGTWYLDLFGTSALRDPTHAEVRRLAGSLRQRLEEEQRRGAGRLKFLACWRWLVLKLEGAVRRFEIEDVPVSELRRLAQL